MEAGQQVDPFFFFFFFNIDTSSWLMKYSYDIYNIEIRLCFVFRIIEGATSLV